MNDSESLKRTDLRLLKFSIEQIRRIGGMFGYVGKTKRILLRKKGERFSEAINHPR
jgi:hypothetical protein